MMRQRSIAFACAVVVSMQLMAPAASHAAYKELNADGSIPSQWNLAKPPKVAHPDVAPMLDNGSVGFAGTPATRSGQPGTLATGDGKNALSFADFGNGDIVVTGGTATGHAGEWDEGYFSGSLYDKCVWSANTKPVNGVQRETPQKYRNYDRAWGLWVPKATRTQRTSARSYCRSQSGEPYDIGSSKTNQAKWYCSKLAWASYKYVGAKLDLDGDGGYWVWPIDLVNDSDTSLFASAN